MRRKVLCFLMTVSAIELVGLCPVFGQGDFRRYFDGDPNDNLEIRIDSIAGNIWQIGKPQKILFDSSATFPNAILTDTINYYPVNNRSSFEFTIHYNFYIPIIAIQWFQKFDLDSATDWAVIEYALRDDTIWRNPLEDSLVENFYGFDSSTVDTMPDGKLGFTGTDTTWRDIWLCFTYNKIGGDSMRIRYTIISDSVDQMKEGWMMDNFVVHATFFHVVKQQEREPGIMIFPNPSDGIVYFTTSGNELIPDLQMVKVYAEDGTFVRDIAISSPASDVDLSDLSDGIYILKMITSESLFEHRILIQH